MSCMKRAQQDLTRKMVFLTGPRQVGETSLALAIAEEQEQFVYLNYDNFFNREVICRAVWLPETRLLIKIEPVSMLEIKLSDSKISPTLRYFH
jgi:predicted AAA+ superfamily ATPase